MITVNEELDTEISACGHRVSIKYWGLGKIDVSDDFHDDLILHAEERAIECINEGYVQGQLVYCIDEAEILGWWKII